MVKLPVVMRLGLPARVKPGLNISYSGGAETWLVVGTTTLGILEGCRGVKASRSSGRGGR